MSVKVDMKWTWSLPAGGSLYLSIQGDINHEDLEDIRELGALALRALERALPAATAGGENV